MQEVYEVLSSFSSSLTAAFSIMEKAKILLMEKAKQRINHSEKLRSGSRVSEKIRRGYILGATGGEKKERHERLSCVG